MRRAPGESAEGQVDAGVICPNSGFAANGTAMAGALMRKAVDYVRSKDFRDYLMR